MYVDVDVDGYVDVDMLDLEMMILYVNGYALLPARTQDYYYGSQINSSVF